MSLAKIKRKPHYFNYWPGFVDALSTLLLSVMFLLCVFVIAQFFLSQEIGAKNKTLSRLSAKINELTEILNFERSDTKIRMEELQAFITSVNADKEQLTQVIQRKEEEKETMALLNRDLESSNQKMSNEINRLNKNITALIDKIKILEMALVKSEQKEKESALRIEDLGKRVNMALAERVETLNKYRSDFFGRLRDILSRHKNIHVVGDRFVFQSELLFKTGSEKIDETGKKEIKKIAQALVQLQKEIPEEIHWVLRVDGHTDNNPFLRTDGRYADNWELSSARAMSVVKHLIANGVPPHRVAAAGFGEFHPLYSEKTEVARSKNRRIEFKLTER